ncbi:MAG: hypothetical protein Q9222_005204 [Ikaeria aurantiellina]
MSGTAYPLGDKTPDGKGKTGDSANFGLFKNNWGNIRRYCSKFKGKSQDQWQDGAVLNTDDAAAIKCQHEQISAQGVDQFYQTQRGIGYGGSDYQKGVEYVEDYLNQGHLGDNWVTYYTLHAV